MLNKNEKKVLKVLLSLCKNNNTCLTSHEEIVGHLQSKEYLTRKEIDDIINNLVLQGYIDNIITDNKGKKCYCVTIQNKGEGFIREEKDKKKVLWQRIGITIALAVLSFVVTITLKAIF